MMALRLRWICAALWLGGLGFIGAIAVPTIFATLPDRIVAAGVASRVFYFTSLAGLGCGAVLVLLERGDAHAIAASTPLLLVFGALLCNVLGEFGVVPRLLASAGTPGAGLWHALASTCYLAQAACVLAYVWRLPGRFNPA